MGDQGKDPVSGLSSQGVGPAHRENQAGPPPAGSAALYLRAVQRDTKPPLLERPFSTLNTLVVWVCGTGVVIWGALTKDGLRAWIGDHPRGVIIWACTFAAAVVALLLLLQRRMAALRTELDAANTKLATKDQDWTQRLDKVHSKHLRDAQQLRGEREALRDEVLRLKSVPDPADVRLFDQLMRLLGPDTEPMRDILTSPFFETNRFHRSLKERFYEFLYEWQIPTRTFHDDQVEQSRRELAESIGHLVGVTGNNMVVDAPMRPDHYAIPADLEITNYSEFMRRVRENDEAFNRLRASYQAFLAAAKRARIG